MSEYDPKQATGIPTEQVGSLPRPQKLQDAYAAYDRGEIGKDTLESAQDEAVKSSIEGQEKAGSPIVSDGEQRWSSFATYPIADTLAGTGLADNLAGDGGQFFAIFADGHHRQLPRLTGGPFRYKTYAADTLAKSIGYAHRPMKQAVIAPSMLYLLYPLEDEVPGYPKEQFEHDLADECERDIRKAFDAGAARVSIDFTEGRLATRNDPRNPWTGAGLLDRFVEINNWVLDRFTPEERVNIGVHTCPGGDRDSVHSADVPYNNLLPKMFEMNAGYFLIQLASERDKDPVYESIGKHVRSDANGVAQTAFVGVINPLNPRIESPEEVRDALVRAANFIPREQLGATDDCGFSPFSIDEKPSHGSPDFAREVAFEKIHNRIEGVRAAAEKLGV
ncbi:5-methyltetrahydropteroyltriglutamate--homocysteine methyltransferase [Actinomycetospora endophytica]|uniref:5-methyltetrahydropteroyltriglutamate--homocysteine methyltransferase n=1 Tax=Actinomycetospora endophytica TaxID=2291215 RepID=A0ABS8PIT1_9PSEU|nr:5-methyltetrahydropteroyltriglutamate--homocysteine methyltransferase [Actinomycetospora endophytica]MCD2198132.1 5-methyltetrahydropteroyltriglutamate--homocysteine methyltransferase [Actinomycetospora endophytica]